MANISHREKILLGYNLNSLSNSSSSRRNSEVDFSDVFGGPPRCSSSTQEFHNNAIDSAEDDDDDDEGDGNWHGLREKPVFGNQIGVRKRYASDDFYDDIFGGDQPLLSCSLSPRHHISPSPAAEPSSSPSKFSLPGRMANTDIMTSTSINQNMKFLGRYLSRFNHTIQNHSTANGDDARTTYQPTTLSRQKSVDEAEFTSHSKADGTTEQHEPEFVLKDYSKVLKFANDNNMQFHFSIYKWANKGVPIVMSPRKRSPSIRSKERRTSGANMVMEIDNGDVNVNEALLSSKPRMPTSTQARQREWNNDDIAIGGMVVECKLEDDKVETNPTTNVVGVKELVDYSENGFDVKSIKHSSKMKKSNTKPLYTLFGQEKEGNKKATAEKELKQSKVNETEKPSLKNEVFPSYKVSRKSKVRESSTRGTVDLRKGQVSEKVKDFVKIFNRDTTSSQVKSDFMGQNHNHRLRDTTKFEALTEGDKFPTKNNDNMQDAGVDFGNAWSEFIKLVDEDSFLSGEQEYNINGSEPNIEGIQGSASKTRAPFVDDDLGKGVMQNMYSQLATEPKEETQSYEHKVRQWSKGKEGNIRALLSTMQNVLWPNSGWKPIPLVEIIEANAVKKAYQRALLCLHPDKLQQKGAAPHHKFIAEKVFDILQEAWDQFNSIGML